MKTKVTALVLMVAALVVAGCSSPAIRIKHNPELFASIPAPEQELIKQGRIGIGFTPDMVKLALGEPDVVARRIDRTGTSEIWRYRSYDSYGAGFHGYYGWGGPYRYRSWGGWYGGWPGYYGWGWSAPAPLTDHLRVTLKDGRVIEINQLR
ncbi:MAG: hypothetical protein LBM04_05125 [Opitutaceae bacterium]|jgi:hypothetical protein|nr:hypothetical protein [Opitutaceae bacterium]